MKSVLFLKRKIILTFKKKIKYVKKYEDNLVSLRKKRCEELLLISIREFYSLFGENF